MKQVKYQPNLAFTTKDECISGSDFKYWTQQVMNNLKFGTELEAEFKGDASSAEITRTMKSKLKPTRSSHLGNGGENGVWDVQKDLSLRKGTEVIMAGKRLDIEKRYEQLEKVTRVMIEHGAYHSVNAGAHVHMLLSETSNIAEVEEQVPHIILRNAYTLFSTFLPGIVHMTATNSEYFTRGFRFRNYSSSITGIEMSNQEGQQRSSESYMKTLYSFGEPYPAIRLPQRDKLHFELRAPDTSLVPTQIIMMQVLYKAIWLKAIEFSRYGAIDGVLLEDELDFLFGEIQRYKGNNEKYAENARKLLTLVKNTIIKVDKRAIPVLEALIEEPVAKRSARLNNDLLKVEKELRKLWQTEEERFNHIIEAIDFMLIMGAESKREWEQQLAQHLEMSHSTINNQVWKLGELKPIFFDKELGTCLFV